MARKRKRQYQQREAMAYARGVKAGKAAGFDEGWNACEEKHERDLKIAQETMKGHRPRPSKAEAKDLSNIEDAVIVPIKKEPEPGPIAPPAFFGKKDRYTRQFAN